MGASGATADRWSRSVHRERIVRRLLVGRGTRRIRGSHRGVQKWTFAYATALRSVVSVGSLVGSGTASNALLLLDAYTGHAAVVAASVCER
jgi:hypothetical protein